MLDGVLKPLLFNHEAELNKNILTLLDLTKDDFKILFEQALALKKNLKNNKPGSSLAGKTLGIIFDKASTRTRISFETAMVQLGGTPIFISAKDTQIARDEPVRDTARVLSRYLNGVAIRTYSQDLLNEFAEYSEIPVINALTDLYHPTQVLSDLLTIIEYKNGYEDLKITWVGDGNNMSHSWINASAVLGLNLVLACPEGYYPDRAIIDRAVERKGSTIEIISDPVEAVKNADVVYTDVWASMGQEGEHNVRKNAFKPFQVDEELIKHAAKDVIIMHCLPAHRGEEISEDVLEGSKSVIWNQSENKLHMNKAILEVLMAP
jgi:ornithine carbamoyltransferase